MGTKFSSRLSNVNRFFWPLIIFSLFQIFDVVFSGFGLVYPCLLPISAYESKDAGKKKAHPKVVRWQELKWKVYSRAQCVFNVEIARRYVDQGDERLIKANKHVAGTVVQERQQRYEEQGWRLGCRQGFHG